MRFDSGVSGKAASRIGEVLKQSAQDHQILCITHTAQIAALADCHLLIQKNVANERTYTETIRWIRRAGWMLWRTSSPATMSPSFPVPTRGKCWALPRAKLVIDKFLELCYTGFC